MDTHFQFPWDTNRKKAFHRLGKIVAMKKLFAIAIVVLSQVHSLHAQDVFSASIKEWGSRKGASLSSNMVAKAATTFLPEDIAALTNGNVLTVQNGAWKQVTAGNLEDSAKKQYLVRPPPTQSKRRKVLSNEKILLDEKVVQDKLAGQLALQIVQSPLPWSPNHHAYATDLQVGFEVSGKHSSRLDSPVTINLTGENAELRPSKITIGRMGQEGFTNVTVTCDRHDADAKVILHSDFGESSFDIPIGPHTSQLMIFTSESRISGYGLGTATVTVKRMAEDGRELSESNSLRLSLTADHGKLDSSVVTIAPGQSSVEVKVRSVGLGTAKVSAETDSFKSDLANLQFVFPLSYIVSALAGGCLGGIARYFRVKAGGKNRKSPGQFVCEGAVVGFLIVAAVAAGVVLVHLPPTVIGTELGALVIATAGGYSGAPILDKLKIVFDTQTRKSRSRSAA
jgi:hypothetical protein